MQYWNVQFANYVKPHSRITWWLSKFLTWDSPCASKKRCSPNAAVQNNRVIQVGRDLHVALVHLLIQRQASFKVRASFSGPQLAKFWRISRDGDPTTSLCITFAPLPYGSSDLHPFPGGIYIPGNAQFHYNTRRKLDEGLEDSPVEQVMPCSQAADVCWVQTWPVGDWRAGTPASLGASPSWFGISVLAGCASSALLLFLLTLFTHHFTLLGLSPRTPFAEGL